MKLQPGTKLGPYEIVAAIGAGGMGEVYKARDSRLNRDVAVKISKAEFTERFTREARMVAQLNHPNICHLYDVGPNYLVMELVDGVPIGGPLPQDKVLDYAVQIADALDAAHTRGIVHRDLKPANILVTRSGRIKLLDFGLARIDEAGTAPDDRPTEITSEGQILGTIFYMSPEQLNGRDATSVSDIFSFGLVLYELLTGKKAFEGTTRTSVIAAILERPAPSVAEMASPALDRLLRRCLEKNPKSRWQSVRDLKAALELVAIPSAPPLLAVAAKRRGWILWVAAAAMAVAALSAFGLRFGEKMPVAAVTRFQIPAPEDTTFDFVQQDVPLLAISPDGRRVVFTADGKEGTRQLWIRPVESTRAELLAGTDGATSIFWSPDSRFIAFYANGRLNKIEASGGPAVTLATPPTRVLGGSWSPAGVIIFTLPGGQMLKISDAGGAPVALIPPGGAPWFLPDGRHFLYSGPSTPDGNPIQLSSLDSSETKVLGFASGRNIAFAQGYLLFLRQRTLVAQPFDPARLATTGEAIPLPETAQTEGIAAFSASQNGVLLYGSGGASGIAQLTLFDREGKVLSAQGDPGRYTDPSLSPDATRAVVIRDGDLWAVDFVKGTSARLTLNRRAGLPYWSPDGTRIAYRAQAGNPPGIYLKLSNGAGNEELLLASSELSANVQGWSPDGRFLILNAQGAGIWALPVPGRRKPIRVLPSDRNLGGPHVSPDGRWISYTSTETGRAEGYVQPFPPGWGGKTVPEGKWMISKGGTGGLLRWRDDGREMLYLSPDGTVMSLDVKTDSGFQPGAPRPLFRLPAGFVIPPGGRPLGDFSSDARRFLFAMPAARSRAELTVVQNWTAALKK